MIKKIKRTITLYLCTCGRCGFEWESQVAKPTQCKKCKSYLWNRPRVRNLKPKEVPA